MPDEIDLFAGIRNDPSLASKSEADLFAGIRADPSLSSRYHRDRLAAAEQDNALSIAKKLGPNNEDWDTLRANADAEGAGYANTGAEDQANRARNVADAPRRRRDDAARLAAMPAENRAERAANEKFSGPDNNTLWQQTKDLGTATGMGARTGAYNAAAGIDTGLNAVGVVSDQTAQNMHDLANESARQSEPLGGAQGTLSSGANFVAGTAGYLDPFLAPLVAGGESRRSVLAATGDNVLANGDQTKANVVGLASAIGAGAAGVGGRAVGGTIAKTAPSIVRQTAESAVAGTSFMAPQPIATAMVAGDDQALQEHAKASINGLPESIAAMAALGMAPGLAIGGVQKVQGMRAQSRVDAQAKASADELAAMRANDAKNAVLWDQMQAKQDARSANADQLRVLQAEESAKTQSLPPVDEAAPEAPSQAPRAVIGQLRDQEHAQQAGREIDPELQRVRQEEESTTQRDLASVEDQAQQDVARQETLQAKDAATAEAKAQREQEHADVQAQMDELQGRLRQFDETAVEAPPVEVPKTPWEKAVAKRDAASKANEPVVEPPKEPFVRRAARERDYDAIDAIKDAGGIDMAKRDDGLVDLPPALKRSVKSKGKGTGIDVMARSLLEEHGIGDGTPVTLSKIIRRAHADRIRAANNSRHLAEQARADKDAAKIEQAAQDAAIASYRAGAEGGRAATVKGGPYLTKAEAGVVSSLKARHTALMKTQKRMRAEDALNQKRADYFKSREQGAAVIPGVRRTAHEPVRVNAPVADVAKHNTNAAPSVEDINTGARQVEPSPAVAERSSATKPVESSKGPFDKTQAERRAFTGAEPEGAGGEPGPSSAPPDKVNPDYKRPDLALVGKAQGVRDAEIALQKEKAPVETHNKEHVAAAKELVDADFKGQTQRMLDLVRSGRRFSDPLESFVMQEVINRVAQHDLNTATELIIGNTNMRSNDGRIFQTYIDRQKTPEGRMAEAGIVGAVHRKPATYVKKIQDSLAAAVAEVARLGKLAPKAGAAPPSRSRTVVKGASKALKDQFDKLVEEANKSFKSSVRSVGAELGIVSRLVANLVARGVVKFADIALSITDHVRTMRYNADAHEAIDRAYDHLQARNASLAPRQGSAADLVENHPRYTDEKKLERAIKGHKTLVDNLEQKVSDFDAMSVEQRADFIRKEAARNELTPEARKFLDDQRSTVDSLRAKLDSLTEQAMPEERKSLEDQILIEQDRIKLSEASLTAKRDELAKMTPDQIEALAKAKEVPPEIKELRKQSAERTRAIRDEIKSIKDPGGMYSEANPAGPDVSLKMKQMNKVVAKLKKQLEKANGVNAKDHERTKVAAKAEGFDWDNIEHWKDPLQMARYLNWLEGRNVSTSFAVIKSMITWARHMSSMVIGKKGLADVIHGGLSTTVMPALNPVWSKLLTMVGADKKGLSDFGEYRHTLPALGKGIAEGIADGLRVTMGHDPKFEAYAEHARIDPLMAKTSGKFWPRMAVRAGQWASLLTPVRIIHAVASGTVARMKVAAHAYRQAVDEGGKRLTGDALTKFMDAELSNAGSESWRMAVQDAQRATYTEPLPAALTKFSAWKSGHSKDSTASNLFRLNAHFWMTFLQIPFNRGRRAASDWTPGVSDLYTLIRFFSGKNEAGFDADGKQLFERNLSKRDIPDAVTQAILRWGMTYGAVQLSQMKAADGHPVLIGNDEDKDLAFTVATGGGYRRKYLELGSVGGGAGVAAGASQGTKKYGEGAASGGMHAMLDLVTKEHQDALLQPIINIVNKFRYQPASRSVLEKTKGAVAQVAGEFAGAFVPSLNAQLQNSLNNKKPDYNATDREDSFIGQAKKAFTDKALPGQLPRKSGERAHDSTPFMTLFDRLMNPMKLEGEERHRSH